MSRLADLRNLGPRSEAMLAAAGITTVAALQAAGAIAAYAAVRASGQQASLNLLWALEGALSGRDWRAVAREDKLRLLGEMEARGIRA